MNISTILNNLAQRRQAFHSESDFQHELAIEIKKQFPSAEIRLEKPILINDKVKFYIDMYLEINNLKIGIELKYKTKKSKFNIGHEEYNLTNHAATNLARYDFLKDVERLQTMKQFDFINEGYAILLTNVPAYWNGIKEHSFLGDKYYISEGMEIFGRLSWIDGIKPNSVSEARLNPINITSKYICNWKFYSKFENEKFDYLDFKV